MKNYLLNLGGAVGDVLFAIVVFVVGAGLFIKYGLPMICWVAAGCNIWGPTW